MSGGPNTVYRQVMEEVMKAALKMLNTHRVFPVSLVTSRGMCTLCTCNAKVSPVAEGCPKRRRGNCYAGVKVNGRTKGNKISPFPNSMRRGDNQQKPSGTQRLLTTVPRHKLRGTSNNYDKPSNMD